MFAYGEGECVGAQHVARRATGISADGVLVFQPPEPTACTTPTGATTAAISGVVSLGSP
jgi:hypothetical protein